jgi:hypothetical protein
MRTLIAAPMPTTKSALSARYDAPNGAQAARTLPAGSVLPGQILPAGNLLTD